MHLTMHFLAVASALLIVSASAAPATKRQSSDYSIRIIVPTASTTYRRGQTVSVDWDATRITPPYTPWASSSCEVYVEKSSTGSGPTTRFGPKGGAVPCGYGTVWFKVPLDAAEGHDWQARVFAFSEPRHAHQAPFARAASELFSIEGQ